MATIAETVTLDPRRPDRLSGTPRAHAIDRWIYVFTAASFVAIVLAGFIPDSLGKIAAVQAGARPPFPPVLHVHAVLMGSFLLLLLAQTWLVATGRNALHMRLGLVSMVLAPAMVVAGFVLAATNYHGVWAAAQVRPEMQEVVGIVDNILLLQLRIGILFPIFLWIGLRARKHDPGLHKRMMILSIAVALPAGIDRIPWLPSTMPASPLGAELWLLVAVSPLLIWDLLRNRYLHRAWWIWLGLMVPVAVLTSLLWNTPWWHGTARAIMGV